AACALSSPRLAQRGSASAAPLSYTISLIRRGAAGGILRTRSLIAVIVAVVIRIAAIEIGIVAVAIEESAPKPSVAESSVAESPAAGEVTESSAAKASAAQAPSAESACVESSNYAAPVKATSAKAPAVPATKSAATTASQRFVTAEHQCASQQHDRSGSQSFLHDTPPVATARLCRLEGFDA